MLALAHSVIDAIRRRSLVRLDVRGTPIVELWHASTLGLGRALPAALALAAVCHHAGGDPGDVQRARWHRVGAGPAGRTRDPVAVGGRGDRR